MSDTEQLIALLRSGGGDAALRPLYAPDGKEAALAAARERAERAARLLAERFAPAGPCALYSAPGRTELGGNHTDHQGGRVLCAAVAFPCVGSSTFGAFAVPIVFGLPVMLAAHCLKEA